MKAIILVFLIMISHFSALAQADSEAVSRAIDYQTKTYPASTLKDIYKSFFQDAFGPGHLMGENMNSVSNAIDYLRDECQIVREEASLCPEYEDAGATGRFVRVNLSVITSGKVSFDVYADAFIRSAKSFRLPDIEDWKRRWSEIEEIIHSKGLAFKDMGKDTADINRMLANGRYASHHSRAYEEAYHPHYRLIERSIFEAEILPLQK